ncbi:MAG: hypothetical protein HY650_02030 [Acidobacteria bacterium]|nr:hypothetical protein [Acidobacteriota bacterium]
MIITRDFDRFLPVMDHPANEGVSTSVQPAELSFNSTVILAEEPLHFHGRPPGVVGNAPRAAGDWPIDLEARAFRG